MPNSSHPHQIVEFAPGREREREKKKGEKGERENRTQIWAKKCEIATSSVDLLFMGGLWWHTGENTFPNSEVDHPK